MLFNGIEHWVNRANKQVLACQYTKRQPSVLDGYCRGPHGLRHHDKYRPSSQQINKIKLLFYLFDFYEQQLLPSLTIYSDIMNIKIINIIN